MNIEKKLQSIIKIVVIEDNKYIRNGWELLIESQHNMVLLGSFSDCESAFETDLIKNATLVIMDIGLPGISGIEGVKYIKEHYPDTLVLMHTVYEDNEEIFHAICAGAVGYLLKKTPPEELIRSILEAINGGSPMTPAIARKVISSFQFQKSKMSELNEKLSEKELQILNLLAQGKSYKAIAEEIYLSIDGVYYHIKKIYEKLHVHSRSEAVAAGLKNKLIFPPK